MKKIILTLLAISYMVAIHPQRIISRTTVIKEHLTHHLDIRNYTDGSSIYELWVINPGMKPTPTKSICLKFQTKDDIIRTLQFLYDLKEPPLTLIDLENLTHNTCTVSDKSHYLISSPDDIDDVYLDRKSIGHFLNALGISVHPDSSKSDDLYRKGDDLY